MTPVFTRLLTHSGKPAVGILAALTLTGCSLPVVDGGSGKPEGSARSASDTNDAADIRQVVTRAFKDTDPATCTELYTQELLEQLSAMQGSDALHQCRDDTKDERAARAVRVFDVALGNGPAEATAVPKGGDSDGLRYQMSLVETGGAWKINRLESVKVIDRSLVDADFNQGIKEEFTKYLPPATIQCITDDVLGSLSNAELEHIIVTGRHDYALQAYQRCDAIRPLFAIGVRKGLAKSDLPKPVEDCVVESLSRAITDRDMVAVLRADAAKRPTPPQVLGLIQRTAIACATGGGKSA
jgi:hypothetical protein